MHFVMRGKSKSKIIGAQLMNIGRQYGMYVRVSGGLANVMRVASEQIANILQFNVNNIDYRCFVMLKYHSVARNLQIGGKANAS